MDKFILAMIALAVILAVIIGGGFIAVEYTKNIPKCSRSNRSGSRLAAVGPSERFVFRRPFVMLR